MTEPQSEYNKPDYKNFEDHHMSEVRQHSCCKGKSTIPGNRTITISALEALFVILTTVYATLNKDVVISNLPAIATVFALAIAIKRYRR
jgi:hypothetical protein